MTAEPKKLKSSARIKWHNMKKISLELPKYRLQIHMSLVKRRKPLVADPIIPSLSAVKRKYRKGSLVARYFRHVFEHKNIQKVFGSGMAMIIIGSTFIPQGTVVAQEPEPELVIQPTTNLVTEKSIQAPLGFIRINQGYNYFHPGLDLGGPVGEPVRSIKPGKVIFAGYSTDGYGNNVVVDHGKGLTSLYAHLSKIEVKDGQVVEMDTEIGQMGRTGRATGPHLHIEVRQDGKSLNPLSVFGD